MKYFTERNIARYGTFERSWTTFLKNLQNRAKHRTKVIEERWTIVVSWMVRSLENQSNYHGKLSLKRENVFKTLLNVSSFGIKVTKMLRAFIYSEHRFIVCGVWVCKWIDVALVENEWSIDIRIRIKNDRSKYTRVRVLCTYVLKASIIVVFIAKFFYLRRLSERSSEFLFYNSFYINLTNGAEETRILIRSALMREIIL